MIIAEIGKITDLTESQVKVYIFRARVIFKKLYWKTRSCDLMSCITIDNYEGYLLVFYEGNLSDELK